ncbi:MAG: CcoQ/FixQ family Cbb3-type cytochrome c oxidase assembly chaperone [Marinovum sp.]|nr:CcoQ/FixQ family Cbb3-type cytochrome c oxidase assembly chaperone [Marinovum sp.]|tara:strand:- start:1622 stop:1816 length:195 start_codon:yes stop_codon:yes gene_type:complete
MSNYDLLREFADSWGLLMMVVLFVGVILFTFRPGSARLHKEMAILPLRNETAPPSASDMKGDLQ